MLDSSRATRFVFQSRMNHFFSVGSNNARSTIPSKHLSSSIRQKNGISGCVSNSLRVRRSEKSGSFFKHWRNSSHSSVDRFEAGDFAWYSSKVCFHELSSRHEIRCMKSCHQRPYNVADVSAVDRPTASADVFLFILST